MIQRYEHLDRMFGRSVWVWFPRHKKDKWKRLEDRQAAWFARLRLDDPTARREIENQRQARLACFQGYPWPEPDNDPCLTKREHRKLAKRIPADVAFANFVIGKGNTRCK